MKGNSGHHFLGKALLVALGFLVPLLCVEATLRVMVSDHYYVWPPNLEKIFKPAPGVMPGISGDSRFLINAAGVRGTSFPATDEFRVLMLGGSTTECLYLDQDEAWPHLMQEQLNEALDSASVGVGNVGKGGHNSRHHLLQVDKLIDQYEPHMVVVLLGVNDMLMRLRQDQDYRPQDAEGPEYHERLLNQAFSHTPGVTLDEAPLYERTRIWRELRTLENQIFSPTDAPLVQNETGDFYIKLRDHRKAASRLRDTLPDMAASLHEYTQNVSAIVDRVHQKDASIVLVTQPTLWRPDLPEELVDLLWFGGVGAFQEERGKEYYSIEALADAMTMYNAAVLRVCRQRSIPCVDLAAELPRDGSVFYDDVHFNESGARQVADILARYLLKSGLVG